MIRSAIAGLVAAAGLLAATLAWELGAFSATAPMTATPPPAVVAERPAEAPDHTAEWVTTILERPLFSPDRRPSGEIPVAASRRTPDGLPRLAGVLVGPFGRSAIFAVEGGKPLVVTEGAHVSAWTVSSIAVGTVQVSGPGGVLILHPSFQSLSASATPTPFEPPQRRMGPSAGR